MELSIYNRLQQAFNSTVVLSLERRRETLEALRHEDAALADAVNELLQADAEHSLLDTSLEGLAEAALRGEQPSKFVETQVGPYRIIRMLGEGGMGVVYLAERLNIGDLVAIKFLRDAWMSPLRRERFKLEQQTLGRLNHHNIARIYDAGTLHEGTPWFVMEYVDGTSLSAWLAAQSRSLASVLHVIKQVAEAVAYAHRHALVHRDLKPSNILVNAAGEVKLLDFGIVRDMSDPVESERTITGLRPLTLSYAAPEQLRGDNVGLFTDVYCLGVLLHKLVTGETPILDQEGQARSLLRVLRARGQTAWLHLSRSEWNDLDAICMKALEVNPDARYASGDAFLSELKAFQEGRVLQARPRSVVHTAAKFIRRNRLVFAIASAALLLLGTTVVLATMRVAKARDAALHQVARMNRLQQFTESLFDGGNSSEGPSAELTIALLLKRGEIEAEGMHDDGQLQASMFSTLGEAYQRLGQLDRADVLLRRALDGRSAASGADSSQYAESLTQLGLLRRDQRRLDEAQALLRQAAALEQEARIHGAEADLTQWALGSVLTLRGQYRESEKVLKDVVAAEGQNGRGDTQQMADALSQLADVYFYLNDYNRSAEINRKALSIYRRTSGDGHPTIAHVMNSLGHIAFDQGHFQDAENDFRTSLALDERWYGSTHPAVAEDLTAMAQVFSHTGREPKARDALLRSLAIEEHTYGHKHSSVALTLNDLGSLAYNRDLDDEAEADFREALAIWREVYGDRHQFVGLAYANLTGVFMDRKNYPQAEAMARQALAIYRETLPPDNVKLGVIHVKLGRILLREQKFAEAEPETREGYRFFATHENNESSYLSGARKDLIAIAVAEHKPELEAELKDLPPRP